MSRGRGPWLVAFARGVRAAVVLVICALAPLSVRAQGPNNPVSLKISGETAPPGGISQVKARITEPKPITTADALISFAAFSDIEGIALPSGDAAGIAVVRGSNISLSIFSPTGTFGTDTDYPLVTIAGRVSPDAPLGTRFPMTIDPAALQLVDPTGTVYDVIVTDGYLVVADRISIGDVIPGSADLPAGAVVSIFGSGFRPDTRVRFNDPLLTQQRYINSGRIDVVLAQPARMHGMRIRARNPDASEATYFSYQRTRRAAPSAHPVLSTAVPLFPLTTTRRVTVHLASTTAGLALQNLEATDTFVVAELTTSVGTPVAAAVIAVPSNRYVVQSIPEIFGLPFSGSGIVTLSASTPIQVLGVDVDASGSASPRLPQ